MASLPSPSAPTAPSLRIPALIALGCGVAAALVILALLRDPIFAAGFLAASIVLVGAVVLIRSAIAPAVAVEPNVDWSVARALAGASPDAVAVTDRAGRLICANDRYEAVFSGYPTPPNLPIGEAGVAALAAAGRAAWRDGQAQIDRLMIDAGPIAAHIEQAGQAEDMLVWRFAGALGADLATTIEAMIAGPIGNRLAASGIMAALITAEGRIRSANRVFRLRAMGHEEGAIAGRDFARFLITDGQGMVRFEREGQAGTPLRVVQIPFIEGEDAPLLVALLDEEEAVGPAIGAGASAHIRSLVSLMPFGIALIDREGRFLQMNDAFVRAADVDPAAPPLYPGDLVVREDKAAVADAVRRFAGGATHSTDMAVRLRDRPDEPVALSIAGARGLGEAAVLMSLKDNSEESRLKREVAQATKMQAVGQLAGGVAHDFNNILTAIIGHCDLMLMRHSPGDSDYDDIQQIRANSNRAASLTRQLLAFSRQQTLRPQVLQLPDVISEVSNLLKRLLGETVTLTVTHGRNLGPVRADPGQLEQVVMNLAVNARDAMLGKNGQGGGTLTIQTLTVTAADVRAMDSEILPVADYTALKISDTGTGIPPEILPKIFEPFFTTKEVGKGTGLGLSTVYGIVKQSGGYIFADSKPGKGTVFTIYLPVHTASAPAKPVAATPKAKPGDLWGSGTILLVEDEDMVRAVAERALTRQGYTVLTAEHGEAALDLLEVHPRPDLLISDVMMPIMDGPTMVRRARERYPDLPILFMSGYAEEQLRKSIDLDNVAFLAKPFSVQQLAEAARDVLAAK
ncbi:MULTISPECIES: ATP-binding protein [unclassified Sphingomonas]|uniref:hybrid sensor histidine kinase/response regulator n=1 Tax=unclassified Sphingomonas TaxID=196159 RepID=UPI000BD29DCE|nr:MAG: hybrid sensor histidine kinase/response regulator [Sphingomonas sp. 12-62-6]OYX40744.1 MAG: hybrid sensor histidine kinase/response regulator [Sphingomonas sp. 32-62-10]